MTDIVIEPTASGHDGYCRQTTGSNFNNSNDNLILGNFGGIEWHSFIRFDNVTIPNSAVIDSAIVRFTAEATDSATAVNVTVHFESADDPSTPSNGADVVGRSLDAGVEWSGLATWTASNTYDTPSIASLLQDIVDRVGWASGQAVIVNIVDNSSTASAKRLGATYDHSSYDPPQLIVTYSVPYVANVSESIEVTESISFESDLIRQENINLTESLEVLLGFDESLPAISEDITLIESVTMVRGFAGIHEEIQNITISEYALVDISPTISVFDSITLTETGNIRPEILTIDSINLSEYVLTRRGYDADVDDSITLTDTFDVFHYSNWLRQNVAQSKQRFFFTLTGATDSTTDIELPASSIFARKRSGDPTYLQVTIPTFNYSTEIALRPNGEMLVDMGYEVDGAIEIRERILEADLEDIATYEGPGSRSVVLTGHRTQEFGGQVVTFSASQVIYRGYQTRARAFRFAFIEPFLNPGDTVVVGNESFTCNNIIYAINHFEL